MEPKVKGGIPFEGPEGTGVLVFDGKRKLFLCGKHRESVDKDIGFAGRKDIFVFFGILIRGNVGELHNFGVKTAAQKKFPKVPSLLEWFGESFGVDFRF